MGFTFGFGTIAPNDEQHWWYSFGGSDRGAQYTMANPLNPGGTLRTFNQAKGKNNDGTVTYYVSVRNVGAVTTNYNIQGGGLT
jgi:hypothetical protein